MMNRRHFLASLALLAPQKWLGIDETPVTVLRYPYLQNVRGDRATIMWATLERGFGAVEYSVDGISYQIAPASSPRRFSTAETRMSVAFEQYQAEIIGLSPNTEYTYRVTVNGQDIGSAGDARFRTAGAGPFDFSVIGDSGEGTEDQFLIANRLYRERPAFVMHTGDIAYFNGTYEEFQRNYFNYYYATMSSTPFFPALGNHEYVTNNGAPCLAVHSLPTDGVPTADRGRYYSFDWGNVHFVALDSFHTTLHSADASSPMLRWLENDLRSTQQFWRVAFFHHPPYAAGPNQLDAMSFHVRNLIVPILEAHGVQAVFNGHEHSYQRSHPVRGSEVKSAGTGAVYFTTGGGGARLYPVFRDSPFVAFGRSEHHYLRVEVRGTEMTVRARRPDGSEIEAFTVRPQPSLVTTPRMPAVTFSPSLAPGSLVRIVGQSLAAEEILVCEFPAPMQLAGTSVTINGRAMPLVYVSGTQIYAQLPVQVRGAVTLKVTTPNGSAETALNAV